MKTGIATRIASILLATGLGLHLASALALDGPGRIEFRTVSQEALESDGTVEVRVRRVGGATGPAVATWNLAAVTGTALDRTATPGADHRAAGGVVRWDDGDAADKVISIELVNDAMAEPRERLALNLSTATGAALGTRTATDIWISDGASGFFDQLVAAIGTLVEQLSGGDVAGAVATLQGAANLVVTEVTNTVNGIIGADTGPDGVWLRGDMHVHDDHSSDGSGMRQTMGQGAPGNVSIRDQVLFAQSQRLDFMALNDHRTFDQHYDPLWSADRLLLLTGEEANSSPHANVFGAMDMINQADNPAGTAAFRKVQQSIWEAHAQGAAWQTNHPDDGEVVTYKDLDPENGIDRPVLDEHGGITPNHYAWATGMDLVEVWNRGTLNRPKIAYAENRWNAGYRFGISGASDSHFRELWALAGPGTPMTHVLAGTQNTPALLNALRAGRSVVNMGDRSPFVTLTGDFDGDGKFETVGGDERVLAPGASVTLRVSVTNGAGTSVNVYRSPGLFAGAPAFRTFSPTLPAEEFDFTVTGDAARAHDWYRVEVRGPGDPDALDYKKVLEGEPQNAFDADPANPLRALTSPIFISASTLAQPQSPDLPADAGAPDQAQLLFGSDADNAFAGFVDIAEENGVVHAVAEVRTGDKSRIVYRARLADGTLTPQNVLSTDYDVARQPAIAVRDGQMWAVWQESQSEMPHRSRIVARSGWTDGRWDDHTLTLSGGNGRAQRPDVALLGVESPVIVWEDNSGGAFDVWAHVYNEGTVNLSAPGKTVTAGNGVDSRSAIHPASVSPKIAVRADGTVAVAWQDNRFDVDPGWTGHAVDPTNPDDLSRSFEEQKLREAGTETDDWEILAVTRTATGWSAPINVSQTADRADRHAAVAFDPAGKLHVAWDSKTLDSAGPRLEIRNATSADLGGSWQRRSITSAAATHSQRPVFGARPGQTPALLWTDGRSADWRWRIARGSDAGGGGDYAFDGMVTGPGNGTWPSYDNGWLAFTSDRAATREQRKPHQVWLRAADPSATPPPLADGDLDFDGVPNGDDNCINVANPDQADADGDRLGDACDDDDTTGGLPDVCAPAGMLPDGARCLSDLPAPLGDLFGGGTPPPPVEHASCAANANLDGEDNYQVTLDSESGQTISFQVMEPKNVDCATRHPLILQGHGFGGSRTTDRNSGSVSGYLAAGYTVISIDQRGFGDSGGTVRVMDPDFEGKDLVAILDWAEDNLDYLAYRDDNLVVGAIGGSYGGGYQFLLHNVDPKNRLDALAPDVTWHDLRYSLNPGDTLKSAFGLLLSAGGEAGSYRPGLENGESPADRGLDPYIVEVLTRAIATGEFPREALAWFNYHSPSYWCELNDQPAMPYSAMVNAPLDPNTMLGGLAGETSGTNTRSGQPAVDVFISQGFRDTLFNVNDAWWNYQCAKARGGDVRLVTHQSGHILDPASLVSNQVPRGTPLDIQAPPGSGNCGSLSPAAARLQWFNQKLRGAPAGSAVASTEGGLCISLADGDAVSIPAAQFLAPKDPRAGIEPGRTAFHAVDTGVAGVPNGALAQTLFAAGQGPAVAPLLEVTGDRGLIVAGLPHATLTVSTPDGVNDAACAAAPFAVPTARTGCDSASFVGLGVLRTGQTKWTLLDDQLTPVRGLGTHELDFAGIAERLNPGDHLGLLVYGYHPQYLGSYSRDPSLPVVNVSAQLQLPLYAVGADGAPDFAADPAGAVRSLEFTRANACSDPGRGSPTAECIATGSAQQMLRTVCDYQWIPGACAFDTLAPEGRAAGYAIGDDPNPDAPLFQVAGAVHNHSGYSDGDPSAIPADYFRAARIGHNVSDDGARDTGVKLDFMIGSEHSDNEKLPITTAAVCVEGFADFPDWNATTLANFLSCSNITGDDHYFKWQAGLEQAIEATERDGAAYTGFTGMRGFEYTNDYYNHLNVYLSSNVANVKIDGSLADLDVFWDWLREPVAEGGGADALVTFNHPGGDPSFSPFDGGLPHGTLLQATKGGSNWNDLAYVDEQIDQRVFGMEVNGGDDIEFFVKGLTNGWHLSPVANEDEHQREWATSNDGKTLAYVRGRSPRDYYHALSQRRTVAVHNALVNGAPGARVQVPTILYWADGADFQSGRPLGSRIAAAGEHELHVAISGLPVAAKVALIGNNTGGQAAPIQLGESSEGAFSASLAITAPASGEDWYFVVLCPATAASCGSDRNYFGVTAPIWFKGAAAPADADGDGVPDAVDQCADTPAGTPVDASGCPVSQGGGFPLCGDTIVAGERCVSEIPLIGPALQALADALLGGGDPAVPYNPAELAIDCTGPAGDPAEGTPEFAKRDADNIYCTTERHQMYVQHPANNPYGFENYGADPYRAPARNEGKRFRHADVDIAGLAGQRGTSYSFDGAVAEVYYPCAEDTCTDMPEGLETFEPPYPIAIVMHGAASDKKHLEWVTQPLAEHGYFVLTANGTGNGLPGLLLNWLFDPANPYKDQLDLSRIGTAGHSLGAENATRVQGDARVSGIVAFDPCDGSGGNECRDSNGSRLHDKGAAAQTPTLFLAADYLGFPGYPQPQASVPGDLRVEGFGILRDNNVDTMLVTPRATTHLDWAGAFTFGNRLNEATSLYYTLAWFDRYVKGRLVVDSDEERAYRQSVADEAFARLTAATFDGVVDRHNISQGYYDRLQALDSGDLEYGGNVPFTVEGLPLADRLSFYHRSVCFISRPDYAGGTLAARADTTEDGDMRASGCVVTQELVDSDGDGVPDDSDAFPDDPSESADADADGTGDNADTDDDNDGVADADDECPTQAGTGTSGCPEDSFRLCDSFFGTDYCARDLDNFVPGAGTLLQETANAAYDALTGGGSEPPPPAAGGPSLASCAITQDPEACQAALESIEGLQDCSFDESGINCAYEIVHDAIGVDTAANYLHALFAQCKTTPAAPACGAIRSVADGGDAASIPVLSRPVPRGDLEYAAADAAVPATKTVDGQLGDWMAQGTRIGGTDLLEFGEHVYADFLFDAFGADSGDDARRWAALSLAGEFSSRTERLDALQQAGGDQLDVPPPGGTTSDHYGDRANREDGTDLTEVRWAADADDLYFLARVARLQDPANLAVLILADTDNAAGTVGLDAGLSTAIFDRAVLLRAGGGELRSIVAETPAVAIETAVSAGGYDNALEARIPRALLERPDGTIRVAVMTVRVSGNRLVPANVAYRFDEPVTIYSERAQALALFAGTVDSFAKNIRVQDLAGGRTQAARPGPGYHERQFVSGANISREGDGNDNGWEHVEQGRLQPYGVFVPSAPRVNTLNQSRMTIWTHYRGGKAHSGAAWTPRLFWQLGEEQGNIVVSPRARSESSWYTTRGHQDFFEVFADAAGTGILRQYAQENLPADSEATEDGLFFVDPARVYISGYSMGGFATYLFTGLYPDLFAAGFGQSGAVTQGAWTGVGPDAGQPGTEICGYTAPEDFPEIGGGSPCFIEANDGRANAQLNFRILENNRYVPISIHHGTNDELALTPGAARMGARLAELQYQYDATTFIGYEHFTQAIVDEWRDGARYLNLHERPENPRAVTYKVVPALVEAVNEVQLKGWNNNESFAFNPDGAYWVDGLVVRDAACDGECPRPGQDFASEKFGQIEAESGRLPGITYVPVPRTGTDVDTDDPAAFAADPYVSTNVVSPANHSTPFVRHGLAWQKIGDIAADADTFSAKLTNLSAATLDLARMGFTGAQNLPIEGTITSDGPAEIRLDNVPVGVTVCRDDGIEGYVDAGGSATLRVDQGTYVFQLVSTRGTCAGTSEPPPPPAYNPVTGIGNNVRGTAFSALEQVTRWIEALANDPASAPAIAQQVAQAAQDTVGVNPSANPWVRRRPLNISHRGGENTWPENTMFAYAESIRAAGSDMIEMDIYETADGELVVIHDATVDRTTDGSGDVSTFTLAQLRAFDAAYWFAEGHGTAGGRPESEYVYRGIATGAQPAPEGYGPADFRIPTLREIFENPRFADVFINIELKPDPNSTGQYEAKLAAMIRAYGRQDDVIVASFLDHNSTLFKANAPEIATSVPTIQVAAAKAGGNPPFAPEGSHPGTGITAGHKAFQVPTEFSGIPVINQEFVDDAHARGMAVQAWTINDRATMVQLLNWCVDGIMTDNPLLLEDVLQSGEWSCALDGPSEEGGLSHYVGALHEHSGFSDGAVGKTPADYYQAGLDHGLDFVGGSEHSESNRLPVTANTDCLSEQLPECFQAPPDGVNKWDAHAAIADGRNAPGSFSAIRGFEWTSDRFGHINVFFSQNDLDAKAGTGYGVSMEDFWQWLALPPDRLGGADGLAVFNHPGREVDVHEGLQSAGLAGDPAYTWNDFAYRPEHDARVVGLEMYGKGGDYYDTDHGAPAGGWLAHALDKGWHVAPVGAEDEHGTSWATPQRAKTVIIARANTRAALRAAMQARRFYAVAHHHGDVRVQFKAGEALMGSRLALADGATLDFSVEVSDVNPANGVAAVGIEVVGPGGVVLETGGLSHAFSAVAEAGEAWRFVRVLDATGRVLAVSAPIWFAGEGGTTPPAAVEDRPGGSDVCENIGLDAASPVCAQLRAAGNQVRAECEAQGGGPGECSIAGGNAHAIVEACYENSGGDWRQQRDGAPLPVCRAVDAFVQGAAGLCRDLTSSGYYAAPVCALAGGVLVSEAEVERYEASWVHRALKLQDRLGFALPLARVTLLHTHNSFNSPTASTPTTLSNSDFNQHYSLTDQLRMDVRAIEVDVHWVPGEHGTPEPVVCHGRGGDELNAGCTREEPLHYQLAEIRQWLDTHPDDVILLYIEDDLGGHLDYADQSHDVTAQVVEEGLGELVYRPADHGSSCSNSQAAGAGTSWLDVSRKQMLDAGKQVLLITESCAPGHWSELFHQKNEGRNWVQGTQQSYEGAAYPECRIGNDAAFINANRGRKFTRVWEDSTVVTATAGGGAPASVTPELMREFVRCGMSLPGVDRLTPRDGRLEAAVWSWAKDEPVASDTKNCAALNAAGRFFAAECGQARAHACVSDSDPASWSLGSSGAWGAGLCPPGSHFGVPANGYANEQLKQAANGAQVWLNYGDAAADGAWVGDAVGDPATTVTEPPPPGPGPGAICELLGVPGCDVLGALGTLVSGAVEALFGADPNPAAPVSAAVAQCREQGVSEAVCARVADLSMSEGGLSRWVDPRIGSFPPGFTNPGPTAPYGMVQPGPDTEGPVNYGGYYFHNTLVSGFSQVHMSAGVYKAGYFPMLPFTGARTTGELPSDHAMPAYSSGLDHSLESADAGYYGAVLTRYAVHAELTASERVALHRYTFNDPAQAPRVLIDVARIADGYRNGSSRVAGDVLTGMVHTGRFPIFFAARFSAPFTATSFGGAAIGSGATALSGANSGVILDFAQAPRQILVKVGISYTDEAGAIANLDAETRTFDQVRAATRAQWDEALARIEVEGGSYGDRVSFYTALYHAQQFPNLHSDVDGRYRGPDMNIYTDARPHYSQFSSWDSYRGQNQLQAEIVPWLYDDMIHSLMAFHEQAGYLPRWQEGSIDASHMSGDPIIPFIGEAWCRGAISRETREALWPMLTNLETRRDALLRDEGYLAVEPVETFGDTGVAQVDELQKLLFEAQDAANPTGGGAASATLEYGIADFSLALMAQSIEGEDADAIAQRSRNYRNLMNPEEGRAKGFIRPRNADGSWLTPFLPENGYGFQEGTSWQYSWMVMHDYAGVFAEMGGEAKASQRLDTFFALPASAAAPVAWPTVQNQITLFGISYAGNQYAPGNEHDLQAPYVYNYTGEPWKTQAVARAAGSIYTPAINGMPGNDDLGALSGWLVWNMAGLYPMNPGTPLFVVGSPVFTKVTLHRPGGDLVIEAPGASAAGKYVQSVAINGRDSAQSWMVIPRDATTVRLEMGEGPNLDFGRSAFARPPSISTATLADFGCSTAATPPPAAGVRVEVSSAGVRLANERFERSWSRKPFRTAELVDSRNGKVWSRDSNDFSLNFDGVEIGSDQFEIDGDPTVQRLPNGATRVTFRLRPAGFGAAPLGLWLERTVEMYPDVAGMRSETWLHSPVPLVISGYSVDEARPQGEDLAGTIHSFRAGADWRNPGEATPWAPVSVGDAQAGDWIDTDRGNPVSGTAQWMSIEDEQDARLFFVLERNDYASSQMAFDGARAKAHVDLSRDVAYIGPFEESAHVQNPGTGPGRHRVVMPGVPLRLEPVFTGFGLDGDDEPWQHYKYLAKYRMPAYRREITFNSNGVDSNRISTGAKDDMDFAETQRQAAIAAELGVETFILDDGWQARSGDWCPDSPDCREANRQPEPEPAFPPVDPSADYTQPRYPARFPDSSFDAVRDVLGDNGGMNLGLWMTPLHFNPTAEVFAQNPQWACHPVGDALVAYNVAQPYSSSNEAGLAQWNLEAVGPNGKAVDYIEGRIRRAIVEWQVKYFKFDFTAWLDCGGANTVDMYGYRESFMAMLDRILRDHPQVTIQMDETNDYRLFPFEALARGPTWYQNGGGNTHTALHANHVLMPFLPPYALGRGAVQPGSFASKSPDYQMAVALLSHMTFFNDLTGIPASARPAIRRWTDYYKAHRADLAQFTYPLLAEDPINEANWAAFQTWNPETGRGVLLAYRQDSDESVKTLRLRNVPDGTYGLFEAPDDQPVGAASAAQLRAGIDINLPDKRTARVLRIQRLND